MDAVADKIRSYSNWIQDISIGDHWTLDSNNPQHAGHINRTKFRRALFIEPLLRSGALKGKRVLDLGCSYGYWAMTAATEGEAAYVLGVDAHERSIDQGRWMLEQKGVTNCELRLADSYETLASVGADSFDVVFCLGFFYHIRDPFGLLSLMHKVTRGVVVVDTMVHNSEEAVISLRPVRPKNLLQQSVLNLELFSSPKAMYWLALEAGYVDAAILTADTDQNPAGIWDYRGGERMAMALSKRGALREVFDNAQPLPYPTPAEDFATFGLYPELHGGRTKAGGQ